MKKKQPKLTKAEQIYASLRNYPLFDKVWRWYRDDICSISGASPGSKPEAAARWKKLEETDFLGYGLDGFRQGSYYVLMKTRRLNGFATPHCCRFLFDVRHGEPEWVTLLQESFEVKEKSDFLADIKPKTEAAVAEIAETLSVVTPEETAAFLRAMPFEELLKRGKRGSA